MGVYESLLPKQVKVVLTLIKFFYIKHAITIYTELYSCFFNDTFFRKQKKNIIKTVLLCAFIVCYQSQKSEANPSAKNRSKIQLYDTVNINKKVKYGAYKSNDILIKEIELLFKKRQLNRLNEHEIYMLHAYIDREIEKKNYKYAESLILRANAINNRSKTQKVRLNFLQAKILYSNHEYQQSIEKLYYIINMPADTLLTNHLYNAYYYIGLNNYKLGNYKIAISYFKLTLEYNNLDESYYFDAYLKLAFAYYRLNKIDEAIDCINPKQEIFLNKTHNPKIDLTLSKILQLRAFLYREKALQNADSLNLLKQSLADCQQSVFYINRYVRMQYFESDQLIFNNRYNHIFYKTIEAINRLHKIEPHDSLLYKAFYYAELDKNLALLRNFQKQGAQKQLQISKSKLTQSDSLSYALLKLEEHIYQLRFTGTADSVLMQNYVLKGELIEKINQTEQLLEKEYPAYFDLKYNLPVFDTFFLKTLSFKKQIIEYVISDEKVYSFLVTNGKIYAHNFTFNDSLFIKIERFRQLIGDINYISFTDDEFIEFHTLGYELYKQLIKPYDIYLNNNPLLIIPDNELNLIPFEAFISKPYNKSEVDYSALHYLVNYFDISYANSVELLKYQTVIKTDNQPTPKALAYAPTYKNLQGNEGSQYLALRDARDNLGKLPGANDEINGIKNIINSVLRVNTDASEINFKKESEKYSVIHCAMHTLIDNTNPLFSKLIFTPNADSIDDGLLNAYEISNLNLKADLVVLSACNTAFGKINKGEGLLSLSRSFIKAGSKSILSTLWSVSDATSVSLINSFYENLANNFSKSKSLSQAKRSYIINNSGIDVHPFYWAGYIVSGNDAPVKLQPAVTRKIYLLLLPVLIVLLGYLYLRRRNISDKQSYTPIIPLRDTNSVA